MPQAKKVTRRKRSNSTGARPDIRAVARLARVSIATVSRAINKVPTVDARLAERVFQAIEELGYSPNTQARALVSGRSRLLGLIVSDITNPFFPELIQGFEDVAVQNGYEILISSTNHDPQRTETCIQRLLERKVDGAAVMTFGIEGPLLDRLARRNVPLVFVDIAPENPLFSTIEVDYLRGIRQGVEHLAELGHRDIAFISGSLHARSSQARREAFVQALAGRKLRSRASWMIEGDHTLEGGMAATERLLRGKRWPTAIMTSNDMTAIGVMHTLYDAGHRVPDDFSVIGFDDVDFARFTLPPLTSVKMSSREIAACAVQALRDHLEPGVRRADAVYRVETRLVPRRTTAKPRA